jgi:hypothetical protein
MKKEQLFTDLNDEQAEKVVGGVGRDNNGKNGWGTPGQPSAGHGICGTGMFGITQAVHGRANVFHVVKGAEPPAGCSA